MGLVPTQLILCYIGSTLKSMSDVLSNDSTARTASFVFVVQLIVAFAAMYYILNAAKKELDKHISGEAGKSPLPASLSNDSKLAKFTDGVLGKCSFCNQDARALLSSSSSSCESCKLLASSSSIIQMT